MIVEDLSGKHFGHWLVLRRAESDARGRTQWRCRCDCGTERVVNGKHLRRGNSRSCGCNGRKDLAGIATGQRYGLLTVTAKCHGTERRWTARCDCGGVVELTSSELLDVRRSCGCSRDVSYVGRRFGKMLVVSAARRNKRGRAWKLRCECGEERVYNTSHLQRVKSCGCARSSRNSLNGVEFGSPAELAKILGLKYVTLQRRLKVSGGRLTARVLTLSALRPGISLEAGDP